MKSCRKSKYSKNFELQLNICCYLYVHKILISKMYAGFKWIEKFSTNSALVAVCTISSFMHKIFLTHTMWNWWSSRAHTHTHTHKAFHLWKKKFIKMVKCLSKAHHQQCWFNMKQCILRYEVCNRVQIFGNNINRLHLLWLVSIVLLQQ